MATKTKTTKSAKEAKTTKGKAAAKTEKKGAAPKRFKTNVATMKKQAAKIRQEATERGGNNDTKQYKAVVGTNLVRILPPWSEEGFFYKDYWVHFIETTNSEGKPTSRPVLCLEKEFGKKCPACEHRKQLAGSKHDSDKELAKKFNRSHRYTMQVIDQNKPEDGIKLWSVSAKLMDEILKWFEKDDWGDITDPEEGYDLEFTRTGKGMLDTKYSAPTPATKNPTELDDWEEILEALLDLDEYVEKMKLEKKEFEALLEGEDVDDDDDDDDDEDEDDEDESEDDEDDSDDEDEDEEDEDEDDEESDSDDEDEEGDYSRDELEEFEDGELVEIAEEDFDLDASDFQKGKGKKKKLDRDGLIDAILEAQGGEEEEEDEDDEDEEEDEDLDLDDVDPDELPEDEIPFKEEKKKKGDSKKGKTEAKGKSTKDMAGSLKDKIKNKKKK